MVFSEVYGAYYHAVAAILKEATEGQLTSRKLDDIVRENAFEESILIIPSALKKQEWQVIDNHYETPLQSEPHMPLTMLEKRWLKTLLQDPRIRLFAPVKDGLEEVEPLYEPGAFVYFDQYLDGDPYEDADYVRHFQTALKAIQEKRKLRVKFVTGYGETKSWVMVPYKMEYSQKEDKFRMVCSSGNQAQSVNIARILSCELLEVCPTEAYHELPFEDKILVFEITDDKNAMERVLLHFSHLKKETTRLDESHYRVKLWYQAMDETEILIRILSFGPVIRVTEPEDFIAKIRQRLNKQKTDF